MTMMLITSAGLRVACVVARPPALIYLIKSSANILYQAYLPTYASRDMAFFHLCWAGIRFHDLDRQDRRNMLTDAKGGCRGRRGDSGLTRHTRYGYARLLHREAWPTGNTDQQTLSQW
ncbi:hypothetical protein F4780DRAFT_722519 [Xylariomycetidae sp. FL0641]|nr:hypothetical protein F4780DRAFT_722519 [Xylariomycetidae sp. FL0641]